ncbi:MAG: hypothetical protein J4432_02480 [DPANN group archaeon]|nr:hypothetical protein [DPANN group archaeon]
MFRKVGIGTLLIFIVLLSACVGGETAPATTSQAVPAPGFEDAPEMIVEDTIDDGMMEGTGEAMEDPMIEGAMEGATDAMGDAMEGTMMGPQTHNIDMSNSGFSPGVLTVKKGDTVTFTNTGSRGIWPASEVHPVHNAYPGSGIQKCFSGGDTSMIFDACGDISPGESYSFTFNEVGTWQYHDHKQVGNKGTIIVEGS